MRLFLILPLSALACTGEEGEDPALHACEHVAEAGTALTADGDPTLAPTLALADEPYTVALLDGEVSHVLLEPTEAVTALLFANPADVVSGLTDPSGAEVLPVPSPNPDCPEDIPEHFDLELEPGTWTLALGPAAVQSVWLMLIEAGEHAHDE